MDLVVLVKGIEMLKAFGISLLTPNQAGVDILQGNDTVANVTHSDVKLQTIEMEVFLGIGCVGINTNLADEPHEGGVTAPCTNPTQDATGSFAQVV